MVSHDCSMALSRGAMGLSAVCDCGIFGSYFVTIFNNSSFLAHSSLCSCAAVVTVGCPASIVSRP